MVLFAPQDSVSEWRVLNQNFVFHFQNQIKVKKRLDQMYLVCTKYSDYQAIYAGFDYDKINCKA